MVRDRDDVDAMPLHAVDDVVIETRHLYHPGAMDRLHTDVREQGEALESIFYGAEKSLAVTGSSSLNEDRGFV